MRMRSALMAGLLAAALLPAPASASAQTEALEGWIVFTSNRDGDYEIYKKRARGQGGAIQLTHNEVMDYEPVWSPSGRRIAFTRRSSGDIYTMWADGTHVRRRTPSSNDDSQPAWSPDGKRIAYSSFWGDGCDILMLELGGQSSDLYSSSEGACNRQPDWSPDGSRVVFIETNFNEASVFIFDVASRELTEVVIPDGMYPSRPRWSPDGAFILYGALDDPEVTDPGAESDVDVFTMAPDGSSGEKLEDEPSDSRPGSWNPAGTHIVFTTDRLGGPDLFIMDLESRTPVPFVSGDADDAQADWAVRT